MASKAGAVNLTVGTIIKVNCLATDGTHEYYDAIVTKTEGHDQSFVCG